MHGSFTAGLAMAGMTVGALSGALFVPISERPFMVVHEVSVDGDEVISHRTVNVDVGIADWTVIIVEKDADGPQVCYTQPGPNVNEGWSFYEASSRTLTMTIDDWAWDAGCAARLELWKDYRMFTTWTPRNGMAPVTHYFDFTYGE